MSHGEGGSGKESTNKDTDEHKDGDIALPRDSFDGHTENVQVLLNVGAEKRTPIKLKGQKVAGLLIALGLLVFLFVRTRGIPQPEPVGPFSPERLAEVGNVKAIGRLLFTDYLLPFEITSILLFVAIIGAVVLARRSE